MQNLLILSFLFDTSNTICQHQNALSLWVDRFFDRRVMKLNNDQQSFTKKIFHPHLQQSEGELSLFMQYRNHKKITVTAPATSATMSSILADLYGINA